MAPGGYGTSATKNEPDPATWERFTKRMVRDIGEGLQLRWQDYLQAEHAVTEASKALGIAVVHRATREAFDNLREDILRLCDWMAEALPRGQRGSARVLLRPGQTRSDDPNGTERRRDGPPGNSLGARTPQMNTGLVSRWVTFTGNP